MKDSLYEPQRLGVFLPPALSLMQTAYENAERQFDPRKEDGSLRHAMAASIILAYEEGERDPERLHEAAAKVARVIVRATRPDACFDETRITLSESPEGNLSASTSLVKQASRA